MITKAEKYKEKYVKKILNMNNTTITNLDLLQLRHSNNFVGLNTIEQIDNKTRLVLVRLINSNYIVVKVKD